MSDQAFTVSAVQLEDVAEIAQLVSDAFLADRQTQMKALGPNPFDMKEYILSSLPRNLKSPRFVVFKAVDKATGDIMGFCNWGFRGFQDSEIPAIEGRPEPSPPAPAPAPPPSNPKSDESAKETDEQSEEETSSDPIKRLEHITSSDMQALMKELMPEGTRCIYVMGLSVSPKYQGRGAGSALLRWGTNFCDENKTFAWVRSSGPAWKMYEKSGFETIRVLEVDLDKYAPAPPPNEGPDAKWGQYVLPSMKYVPKA